MVSALSLRRHWSCLASLRVGRNRSRLSCHLQRKPAVLLLLPFVYLSAFFAGRGEGFPSYEVAEHQNVYAALLQEEAGWVPGNSDSAIPLRTALESLAASSPSFQCNASYARFRQQEAANSLIPETQKLQDLPESTRQRWPSVNVSCLGGDSDFGWVETVGDGLVQAKVNTRTCALIAVQNKEGQRFDQGSRQRAFFSALIMGGQIRMAGDVTYLPSRSMHALCYTLPTSGQFLLKLRLVFTNTFEVTNCLKPENAGGFAGYETVLSSWVKATSTGSFNLTTYRSTLPLCTMAQLSERGNRGFWNGDTWYPEACRLTRLSQRSMLLCLDGKRVLMLGDSQMRISSGLLQTYFNYSTRDQFLESFRPLRFALGDILSRLNVSAGKLDGSAGPPLNESTGMAATHEYNFLGGTTTYYGGAYQGYFMRQVDTQVDLGGGVILPVTFNLTFSSQFGVGLPLFNDWKLSGDLTSGVTVTDGGIPVDLVVLANQIHDSEGYDNPLLYLESLTSEFLPDLASLLKNQDSFTMFGALSAYEARKVDHLFKDNNARHLDFERTTREYLKEKGYQNFLDMTPLTSVREDLAYDATHYTWPVSLAMMDLWLGSYCPVAGEAT